MASWSDVPAPELLCASSLPFGGAARSRIAELVQRYPLEEHVLAELTSGKLRFFNADHATQLADPPDFLLNTFSGLRHETDQHWSAAKHRGAEDIKVLWEPSRFSWAFLLARAFTRSGDLRLAEQFWRWFEQWCKQNPPNVGPNWSCGQEASIRLFAVSFALAAFEDSPATTDARLELAGRFVAATGRRIEANIGYARLQRNNHFSSEAAGFLTAGILLRESDWGRRAIRAAARHLEAAAAMLIAADGSSTQDSMNYHRVLLHGLIWAVALAQHSRVDLGNQLHAQLERATRYLHAMSELRPGATPFYGANDGALLLPLSCAAYGDLAPTLELARCALGQHGDAPCEESAIWLFASARDAAEHNGNGRGPHRPAFHAAGRTEVIRAGDWTVWHRSPRRSHGAVQDQDHVLVSFAGQPVIVDRGTWSYHGVDRRRGLARPRSNRMIGSRAFRTVTVRETGLLIRDEVVQPADGEGATVTFTIDDPAACRTRQGALLPGSGLQLRLALAGSASIERMEIVHTERFPTYRDAKDAVDLVVTIKSNGPFQLHTFCEPAADMNDAS